MENECDIPPEHHVPTNSIDLAENLGNDSQLGSFVVDTLQAPSVDYFHNLGGQ
jgi:hypothetical protein